jgi:hypothetical protein
MLGPWRKRVMAAGVAVGLALMTTPAIASGTPVSLVVPQATAFKVLGHDCGTINEKAYITQFDTSTGYTKGYPDGDAYIWTNCSCGKVCSTTYKAWLSTIWDFTATLVTYTVLASPPTINPTLSLTDSHGNQIYNQTDRAYLVLAPGFVPAPRVASLSPSSAPQGTIITIAGTGFTGATAVHFGINAAVSFTVNSDTQITAIAPAGRTATVPVTVIGPGGTSASNPGDKFTFTLQPRISSLSPTSGSADGGTKVTITGVNFTGATAVTFGGAPASFTVISSTKITAISPPASDPVTVYVAVTSAYGTSAPGNTFTYT